MADEKAKKASKAHKRYRNADGKIIPGTTTITGGEDKPALKFWANDLGLQGINVRSYVDELAKIGTLAHYMAECHVSNQKLILDDYTPNQIEVAEICADKFFKWIVNNDFELLLSEKDLISELFQYGGKIDLYGILNGKKALLDIKTSKTLYPEVGCQVGGGYKHLLEENGYEVEEVFILRIGRNEDEGFELKHINCLDEQFEKFLALKNIYDLNKIIKKAW